ncbi:MAG: hypothetical protein JHC33_08645 [Ignisphaera sp.]|jgi:hypothetical protein|nr:hypothetical protein [Ignisphaera sp.]
MIERKLIDIFSKPSDFKVCGRCNRINWYENYKCVSYSCNSVVFIDTVDIALKDEYAYWQNEEGYTEEEADEIFLEC